LYAVLEQRKLFSADRTDQQMQTISEKFGLDKPSVQTLYKYVNNITPLDVGSDDERQRGVWVNSREQMDRYAEQARAIAQKREQARKADKAEQAGDSKAGTKSKKEKELEELFTD
jgi:Zn-finger nucleic acid-binding protein